MWGGSEREGQRGRIREGRIREGGSGRKDQRGGIREGGSEREDQRGGSEREDITNEQIGGSLVTSWNNSRVIGAVSTRALLVVGGYYR